MTRGLESKRLRKRRWMQRMESYNGSWILPWIPTRRSMSRCEARRYPLVHRLGLNKHIVHYFKQLCSNSIRLGASFSFLFPLYTKHQQSQYLRFSDLSCLLLKELNPKVLCSNFSNCCSKPASKATSLRKSLASWGIGFGIGDCNCPWFPFLYEPLAWPVGWGHYFICLSQLFWRQSSLLGLFPRNDKGVCHLANKVHRLINSILSHVK